jgi:thioredoxin-dependent peroxiredoxin
MNRFSRVLAGLLVSGSFVGLASALKVGENAPLPNVVDSFGKPVKLDSFKGKWIVLFFYPKAGTPGCTAQNIEYTKLYQEFLAANAVVFGVSNDSGANQCKFIAEHGLKVPQLPDQTEALGKAFGVAGFFSFYSRDTFVIDPKGQVALVKRDVNAVGDAREVLGFIKNRK